MDDSDHDFIERHHDYIKFNRAQKVWYFWQDVYGRFLQSMS